MSIPHVPATANELEAAIRDGILGESLHFDAKAAIEPGAKANRALAVDMAAMAVNGGLIGIGIAEERSNGAKVHVPAPVALAGLRERVSQVGLSRVDPPLTVVTRELQRDDSGGGYLLILVPPSPDAPHMVDGQYRGRGDTTNYVMGDAEVRRVQAQRRGMRLDIGTELERAVAADPTPPELRTQAHLFVVARPTVPTGPGMLQSVIDRTWQHWLRETVINQPKRGYWPDLTGLDQIVRRPSGWAVTSYPLDELRAVDAGANERDVLELEVDEDGSLRLFTGAGSDVIAPSVGLPPPPQPQRWVWEEVVSGLTWRVLWTAATISSETSYVGGWDIGVALTNAHGVASFTYGQTTIGGARLARADVKIPFAAGEYRATTEATHAEVAENRHAVLERLLGRLNRALNDDTIPLPNFEALPERK